MRVPLLARSGLSLDRLASFLEVVEGGGLAAAARGEPVRQSQLSRQLKELEEFFGCTLIERGRGRFRMTAAGQDLCRIVRTALICLQDLEQRCAREPAEVHLGAGESVLVWFVLPRLGAFLAREAQVVLTLHNLQSEEILRRLRDGRLDFGIFRGVPPQGALRSAALKPVEHTLFVARSALPQRRSLSPEAVLARVPLALLEGSSDLSQAVADWAETRGVSLRPGLRCTSLLQASEAVKHLGMAAILPTWAELAFAPGEVTTLGLPGIQSLRAPLHLVWSKRQGVVRSFLAQVAKALCTSLAGEGG